MQSRQGVAHFDVRPEDRPLRRDRTREVIPTQFTAPQYGNQHSQSVHCTRIWQSAFCHLTLAPLLHQAAASGSQGPNVVNAQRQHWDQCAWCRCLHCLSKAKGACGLRGARADGSVQMGAFGQRHEEHGSSQLAQDREGGCTTPLHGQVAVQQIVAQ